MKLPKSFNALDKEHKISFLLEKYSCNEIASMLVEQLCKTPSQVSKIRISQDDFEKHFHIIKPYNTKKGVKE